jgi:hypothetical protein
VEPRKEEEEELTRGLGKWGVWQAWGKGDVRSEFRLGNLKGRQNLRDLDIGGRTLLKYISKK